MTVPTASAAALRSKDVLLRQSAASATATAPASTPCTTHAIALVAPIMRMMP